LISRREAEQLGLIKRQKRERRTLPLCFHCSLRKDCNVDYKDDVHLIDCPIYNERYPIPSIEKCVVNTMPKKE
jgi:hypothetical protein